MNSHEITGHAGIVKDNVSGTVHKLQNKLEQEIITGHTELVNKMLQDKVCGGVEPTRKTGKIKKL